MVELFWIRFVLSQPIELTVSKISIDQLQSEKDSQPQDDLKS